MELGLLLNVVIRTRSAFLQHRVCKDQLLLMGWNACFALDFRLDVVNGFRHLGQQYDGLANELVLG